MLKNLLNFGSQVLKALQILNYYVLKFYLEQFFVYVRNKNKHIWLFMKNTETAKC